MSWSNSNGDPIPGATPDDDVFNGTTGADIADGLAGNDVLSGSGGNDSLVGGDGDDYLQGDAGNDTLVGGIGEDQITGGADHDSIVDEGGGATYVDGGTGNDTIAVTVDGAFVSFGTDLRGGSDDDSIVASGPGVSDGPYFIAPVLSGDDGNDTIIGTDIDDPTYGGDQIYGGTGNDSILAGGGNDLIDLGTGNDTVDAGSGDDAITAGGVATVDGSSGDDTLTINQTAATAGLGFTVDGAGALAGSNGTQAQNVENFSIRTGSGNDTVIVGEGNDDLRGGGGHDSLVGGAGDDYLQGDAGNDTLVGGAGFDQLSGGTGDDSLVDSDGGEIVADGGAGNDTIVVTVDGELDIFGADLRGGEGNDSIVASGPGLISGGATYGAAISGGGGDDTIIGTDADDPNTGNDNITGDAGNDSIIGGKGADWINAGGGDDTVVWRLGDGDDIIDGGADTDVLALEGWTTTGSNPWTVGSDGAYTTYTHTSGAVLYTTNFESTVCFAAGTHILTPRGEVPVETLRAGDLVLVPLAAQRVQPLRWVGHRQIDLRHARDRSAAAPVLIRAGALGPGVPCRDMRVSPEHGFLLDGRLVPARLLIDGAEVIQENWCQSVTYWHLELDAHGILVADGALAESYFDDGNRQFFDNPGLIALRPTFDRDRAGRYATEACAPPILDAADPALAAIRARRVRAA